MSILYFIVIWLSPPPERAHYASTLHLLVPFRDITVPQFAPPCPGDTNVGERMSVERTEDLKYCGYG